MQLSLHSTHFSGPEIITIGKARQMHVVGIYIENAGLKLQILVKRARVYINLFCASVFMAKSIVLLYYKES